MSKSQRTQEWYRKASKGQGTLSSFSFKAPLYPQRVTSKETVLKVIEPDLIVQPQPMDLPKVSAVVPQSQIAGPSWTRSASVLSDPSTDNDETASALTEIAKDDQREPELLTSHHLVCMPLPLRSVPTANQPEPKSSVKQEELEVELEGDEYEIEEEAQGLKLHVRNWADLWKEIKDNLKRRARYYHYPISVN
jgi:hypothetical protein